MTGDNDSLKIYKCTINTCFFLLTESNQRTRNPSPDEEITFDEALQMASECRILFGSQI